MLIAQIAMLGKEVKIFIKIASSYDILEKLNFM